MHHIHPESFKRLYLVCVLQFSVALQFRLFIRLASVDPDTSRYGFPSTLL